MVQTLNIKETFYDYKDMKPETWSDVSIHIPWKGKGETIYDRIEIGLYREDDGTYTLEGFDGDEVIICKTNLEV